MSEEREVVVPAFYPDFEDAEYWKSWDGSREAWMWADMMRERDRILKEMADMVVEFGGPNTDVGGLMAELWATDNCEIKAVVHASLEEADYPNGSSEDSKSRSRVIETEE